MLQSRVGASRRLRSDRWRDFPLAIAAAAAGCHGGRERRHDGRPRRVPLPVVAGFPPADTSPVLHCRSWSGAQGAGLEAIKQSATEPDKGRKRSVETCRMWFVGMRARLSSR